MTAPLAPFWPADQLAEARAVIADVAHHSDHLIRLACTVLARHGENDGERREARALLYVIEARTPLRHGHHQRHDDDGGDDAADAGGDRQPSNGASVPRVRT
jgi:hypothetical protein